MDSRLCGDDLTSLVLLFGQTRLNYFSDIFANQLISLQATRSLSVTLFIIAALSALTVSFICSLEESCLLSLSLADIANINEQKPATGRIWKKFRENIQKPISVILITNTFAHTIGSAISGAQFGELYGQKWVGLYSIVFSLVMIQFTEILPKTLGVRYNIFFAKISGVTMNFMIKLFTPLLFLVEVLNKPFEGGKKNKFSTDALNEILLLARFASLNKLISKEQEKIVSRSLNITKATAKDIMVPREDIKFLTSAMNLMDALVQSHVHHHTRFPLTEENNLDKIIGYVNFKDIVVALRVNPTDPTLKGIARPILRIKQNENLSTILGRMTQGHHHIALVVNDAGVTLGMVTMEDAIEPIVGEIEDEFDILPTTLIKTAETTFIAGGAVNMNTLHDQVSRRIPGSSSTLDEWMQQKLRKKLQINDSFTENEIVFRIKKIRRDNIFEAVIQI